MRKTLVILAVVLSAPALADEDCFKVGEVVYTPDNMPVIVTETHCGEAGGNWYVVAEVPGMRYPKRYEQGALRLERDQPY